jgi:hypothetical protein
MYLHVQGLAVAFLGRPCPIDIELVRTVRLSKMYLLLLEHENDQSSPPKDIASFIDLRTATVL